MMVKARKLGLTGRGLLTVGTALSLAGSGCGPMNEYDAMSASANGFATNAKTPKQALSWGIIATLASTAGKRQYKSDAKGTGKREVNAQGREEIGRFFTCNYWKDLNNDGKADFPHEFVNGKTKFKKGEKLSLVLQFTTPGLIGKNVNVKIYDPRGELVLDTPPCKLPYENATMNFGEVLDLMEVLSSQGGTGVYKAAAYIDDGFMGSHEFEITR
jgi:hypothetical protein